MALQLLTCCLGSYSAGLMIYLIQVVTSAEDGTGGWLPRDINYGHLDKYFLFLAGAMAINMLFYLVVAGTYEYKEVEHEYQVPTKPRPPSEPSPQQVYAVRDYGLHIHARARARVCVCVCVCVLSRACICLCSFLCVC
jgi:hypothetical protein